MRFTAFDSKKVKNVKGYKYSPNIKLLDEFKESGIKCAKVTEWTCEKAEYCSSSLQQTIKCNRQEYKNILCILRRGEVFLINEAVD